MWEDDRYPPRGHRRKLPGPKLRVKVLEKHTLDLVLHTGHGLLRAEFASSQTSLGQDIHGYRYLWFVFHDVQLT